MDRMRTSCGNQAQYRFRFLAYSVASSNARAPPPAAAARAARPGNDRRGGRRAPVHALGGLAAARDARARGGRALLEPAGRGVRLTDAALVLVDHAEALLDRAALAEADLAAAAGTVAGRGRIAGFESVALGSRCPLWRRWRGGATAALRVARGRARGGATGARARRLDLVLGDEWQHQPRLPAGVERHDLNRTPCAWSCPPRHPVARRHPEAVPLAELAGEAWTTGHPGLGWEEVAQPHLPRAGRLRSRHPTPHERRLISLALVAAARP